MNTAFIASAALGVNEAKIRFAGGVCSLKKPSGLEYSILQGKGEEIAIRKTGVPPIIYYGTYLGLNLFLVFTLVRSASRLPEQLRPYHWTAISEGVLSMFVADLDKNGQEEILAKYAQEPSPYNHLFSCFSPFQRRGDARFAYILEDLLAPQEVLLPPLDLDCDGLIDIPILWGKPEGLQLKLLSMNKSARLLQLPPPSTPFDQDTNFGQALFEDLNADSFPEMIVAVQTSWKAPRGILAYDLRRREKLWEFPCGCYPWQLRILILDGSGQKAVAFSGWGSHNHVALNGTDDDHSYLIVLSPEGNLLSLTQLGGYYTKVFFDCADTDADGEVEVITAKSCHRGFIPEAGEVRVLDPRTGRTEQYLTEGGVWFTAVTVASLSSESRPSILVGDSEGRLRVLDGRLRETQRCQLPSPLLSLGLCAMGPRPTSDVLYAFAGRDRFVLLNSKLKEVFRFTLKRPQTVEDVTVRPIVNKAENALLLNSDELYLIHKERFDLAAFGTAIVKSGSLLYLFFLFSVNYLFFYLRQRRSVTPEVLPEVRESWTEYAQDLAHQMKTPLFTIQLEAERLNAALSSHAAVQEVVPLKAIPNSILEDVGRLKKLNRSLMKFISVKPLSLVETDINTLLRYLAGRYQASAEGRVEFVLDLDEDSTVLPLDEEQMSEALSNLIENAIEAMPQGGRITLSTTVVFSPSRRLRKIVEVGVEDTGKGIPADKLAEVFRPYYSTKAEGSGIGLPIVKRIAEAHGGRVEVRSKDKAGTRVTLILPVLKRRP